MPKFKILRKRQNKIKNNCFHTVQYCLRARALYVKQKKTEKNESLNIFAVSKYMNSKDFSIKFMAKKVVLYANALVLNSKKKKTFRKIKYIHLVYNNKIK